MQNPLANFIGVFSLVRDDRDFQVNPLCRHDITSPFPPSENGGYVRTLHSKKSSVELTLTELISTLFQSLYSSTLSGVKLTLSK